MRYKIQHFPKLPDYRTFLKCYQKFKKMFSHRMNAGGGYFRQCDRLIRDQNQHHFNCTWYHPMKQPCLLQSSPVSALCSHDDVNSVSPFYNGNRTLLESWSTCFPFWWTKFYELCNKTRIRAYGTFHFIVLCDWLHEIELMNKLVDCWYYFPASIFFLL